MKLKNTVIGLLASLCAFAVSMPVNAANQTYKLADMELSNDLLSKQEVTKVNNMLEGMSDEELNQIISDVKNSSNSMVKSATVPTGNIQLAWLAAAQIAENNGYPCAAALVRASVNNSAYTETIIGNGVCRNKIKTTSLYKNYVKKLKAGSAVSSSMTFTKATNADLFYALHKVSISYTTSGYGNLKTYNIKVHDVFDFAKDNNYNDLFTTLVNNWAWLCQQTGVLNPINVNIYLVE